MKKFIALALVTVGVTVSTRAQWIVFDPTMNVQSILNTARGIAEFVEMINNQVQQIQTLTDQLNEFKHYKSLFGDPKAVLLSAVKLLREDLRKTEHGQTPTLLEDTANVAAPYSGSSRTITANCSASCTTRARTSSFDAGNEINRDGTAPAVR